MRVWPGRPYPLGAVWDGAGANFALFSENATKVELCLFDGGEAPKESLRIPLPEHIDQVKLKMRASRLYIPPAQP